MTATLSELKAALAGGIEKLESDATNAGDRLLLELGVRDLRDQIKKVEEDERQNEERQRAEEAWDSPLGQLAKYCFDFEDYDHWDSYRWPALVDGMQDILDSIGVELVEKTDD